MVFDEVDSGIGGGTAEIVGRQLRELGRYEEPSDGSRRSGQVLCVTHLAQVAAQAHTQFRVIKQTDGKVTRTVVNTLNAADRIDEIARMLGGIDISDQARAHAREMLGQATAAAKRGTPARAPAAPAAAPGAAVPGKKRAKAARN